MQQTCLHRLENAGPPWDEELLSSGPIKSRNMHLMYSPRIMSLFYLANLWQTFINQALADTDDIFNMYSNLLMQEIMFWFCNQRNSDTWTYL